MVANYIVFSFCFASIHVCTSTKQQCTGMSELLAKGCKKITSFCPFFFFYSALSPSLVVVEGEGMPCWLISRKEPSSGKSHRSMTAVPPLSTVSNILPR